MTKESPMILRVLIHVVVIALATVAVVLHGVDVVDRMAAGAIATRDPPPEPVKKPRTAAQPGSEREACLASGGRWEEQSAIHCLREPRRVDCEARGGRWQVGRMGPQCVEATELAACKDRGGTMQMAGRAGRLTCIRVADDGGKPCDDGGQCSLGRCLYSGDPMLLPARSGLSGQCARNDNSFGCFTTLSKGQVAQSWCAD
ncbi:MAG: hypothetical protein KF903_10340 [Dokdonella sp.]|uniref:hypothetical protein n=1 Tax=Dokdonella sp. TaxID=2291710 RepID=UPI0025C5B18C|nr:hypothetical protein [Dokdonella sp.]MBX3701378.1 hypothetical protein [Dokdonella sp.]